MVDDNEVSGKWGFKGTSWKKTCVEPCFAVLYFFQAQPVCQNFSWFRRLQRVEWVLMEFNKHWVLLGGGGRGSSAQHPFTSQLPEPQRFSQKLGSRTFPHQSQPPTILTASFFISYKAKHQMPLTELILLIKQLSGKWEHEWLILYFRYQTLFSCLPTEYPNYELFDGKNITFFPFYLLWFP